MNPIIAAPIISFLFLISSSATPTQVVLDTGGNELETGKRYEMVTKTGYGASKKSSGEIYLPKGRATSVTISPCVGDKINEETDVGIKFKNSRKWWGVNSEGDLIVTTVKPQASTNGTFKIVKSRIGVKFYKLHWDTINKTAEVKYYQSQNDTRGLTVNESLGEKILRIKFKK